MANTSRWQISWRNRSTWILSVVLCITAWLTWPYLSLLAAISFVASDNSTRGEKENIVTGLHSDNIRLLSHYPPEHLAMFLRSPSARIRAVACQVLGSPEMLDGNHDWTGIPAALARVAANDSEERVRDLAILAIQSGPDLTKDDLLAIQSIAGPELPLDHRRRLVQCLGERAGEHRDAFIQWLRDLASSKFMEDQVIALGFLAEHVPDDPSLPDLFCRVLDSGQHMEEWWLKQSLRQICRQQPRFLAELLQGSENKAALALGFLSTIYRERLAKFAPMAPGITGTEGSRIPRPSVDFLLDDSEILQLADVRSQELLGLDHPACRAAAIVYLGRSPEGAHALLAACMDGRIDSLVGTLNVLERFTWSASRNGGEGFVFTPAEADYLTGLLRHPDPQVREAAAGVVHPAVAGVVANNPFPNGCGPRCPSNAPIFAELLADRSGKLHWIALEYFDNVVPFETQHLKDIANAIRIVHGRTRQTYDAFMQMTQRFPNHPCTIETAKFLLDGAVGPSSAFVAAASFLFDSLPDQVFGIVVQTYHATEKEHAGPLLELILDLSKRRGGFNSPSFALEIWSNYLAWCLTDRHGASPTCLREIWMLIGPDIAEAGLRRAIADAFRKQTTQIMRLNHLPRFSSVLTEVAVECLESPDVFTRLGAVQLLPELTLSNEERRHYLLQCMRDSDPRIAIQSVELIMKLGLGNDSVIDELRQLATEGNNSALRSVALEMLAAHTPRDVQTVSLVQSLLADPDFQVRLTARHASRSLSQLNGLVIK